MKRTKPSSLFRAPSELVPDEKRLIERALRGDAAAGDALVRMHYRSVHGTAFRLLGNHEDAEDLAQECFVRALRGLAWFRGDASFGGWLRRITVHLARDRFRRAGRRPDEAPLSAAADAASERGPDQELSGKELVLVVSEAIERLPDHQRVPLLLRTREGLPYAEIAATTGVTPATARTQVMKARRALLRSLDPYLARRES